MIKLELGWNFVYVLSPVSLKGGFSVGSGKGGGLAVIHIAKD